MTPTFQDQPLKGVLRRPALSDKDVDFAINFLEETITRNYFNKDDLKTEIESVLKTATDSLFGRGQFSYDQARAVMIAICPRLVVDIDFFLYELKKTDSKKEFINYLANKIPGFDSFQVSNELIDTLLINFLDLDQ